MPHLAPTWGNQAAMRLAEFAHTGQTDKAGKEYIWHPNRVAIEAERLAPTRGLDPSVVFQVGVLHDTLEDTRLTSGMLQELGCPAEVVLPVMLLTRNAGYPNDVYYARIRENSVATLVKQCDIEDNLKPHRMRSLQEDTQARLQRKYRDALNALGLHETLADLTSRGWLPRVG